MLSYQVLRGVNLSGATGLPTVELTPEGRAMASIPGWSLLVDPAKRKGDLMRNRVVAGEYLSPFYPALFVPPVFGTFSGGAPALELSGQNNELNPNVRFNPPSWSFFAVFHLDAGFSSSQSLAYSAIGNRDDEPYPRLGVGSGGTVVQFYGSGTTMRVTATPATPLAGRTALLMYTFSTREGCRIYIDGTLGGHNPAETEPFAGGDGPGEWLLFDRNMTGKIGMTGLLDIDLGWAEHAGYRRSIERFLMDKYGIA